MRVIELAPAGAVEALAAEEAALESAAGGGGGAWLLWTAPARCAVLGTARPAAGDLCLEALRAAGAPVWRRRSGGGTVLLGPESPVATMVAPLPAGDGGSIRESYLEFTAVLVAALGRLGAAARFEPPADLAAGARKLAGSAQRRVRGAALVTASVLAGPLAAEAGRFLREPGGSDAPAYRAGRPHAAFMGSLAELGVPDAAEGFRRALRAELLARGGAAGELAAAERARAAELAAELSRPEWVFRL